MKKKKRAKSKAKSTRNVRRTKKLSLFIVIPLILISIFVIAATVYKIVDFLSIDRQRYDIPKLEISLQEVPIEEIDSGSKDTKYPNNIVTLTIGDNNPTVYENVEIKGRGNTTWGKAKKPYQIKLESKENILNLGENKKWILLANALDSTSLRTDTAFYLEKILKVNYPLEGNFIELYIDNSYRGIYYLTKKMEIGKNRINLNNPYGILMELDNIYGEYENCYRDALGKDCLTAKDLIDESTKETSTKIFMDGFNSLKIAIKKKNYNKINELIDIDSFAKYYLLSEFITNPDAYSTSFYMYQDGEEDRIHSGPGWDFDLTLGNKAWTTDNVDMEVFYSPYETMALRKYPDAPYNTIASTLLYDLMEIPGFEARVKEIYQETLSGKKEDVLDHIRSQAEYIRPAALRDQERWKLKTNFDDEVNYLVDWVSKRFDHFEQTYGKDSGPINPDPALKSQPLSEE